MYYCFFVVKLGLEDGAQRLLFPKHPLDPNPERLRNCRDLIIQSVTIFSFIIHLLALVVCLLLLVGSAALALLIFFAIVYFLGYEDFGIPGAIVVAILLLGLLGVMGLHGEQQNETPKESSNFVLGAFAGYLWGRNKRP